MGGKGAPMLEYYQFLRGKRAHAAISEADRLLSLMPTQPHRAAQAARRQQPVL